MGKPPTFLQKSVRTSNGKHFDECPNDWSSGAGACWDESAANTGHGKGILSGLLKDRLRLEMQKFLYMYIGTPVVSYSVLLCVPLSARTLAFLCSCEQGIWRGHHR